MYIDFYADKYTFIVIDQIYVTVKTIMSTHSLEVFGKIFYVYNILDNN